MRRLVFLAAGALLLTGCGASPSPEPVPDAPQAQQEEMAEPAAGPPAPPEFFFTGEQTAPSDGTREVLAVCGDNSGAGQWIFDFLVPSGWEENGAGNSGGGFVGSNGSGDISHTTPEGTKVWITVKQDDRDFDGKLLDNNQEPMADDNFDYSFERSIGDEPMRTIQVKYDQLSPVTIDGQTVSFASVDQVAAELDYSEFVSRLRYADMPMFSEGNERVDWSATVTFSWDKTDGSFDEAAARSTLESFRFNKCAQDSALEYLGLVGITEFAE